MLGEVFWDRFEVEDRGAQPLDESMPVGVRQQMDALHHDVQRLKLINQALWELLRERARLTDEDLVAKMQEVDLRDGKEDGEITDGALRCPDCGRVSASRHGRCLYCGTLFDKPLLG